MSCVTRRRPPLSPKFDHVGGQSKVGQQHHHPGLASFLPTFFYGNAVDRTPIISGGCARTARGPRGLRAAEQRDELAPLHSITSSASASSLSGTLTPSAFAVLRLMTSSNLVGCSTGMSAGFVPLRILSTSSAARRKSCRRSGP